MSELIEQLRTFKLLSGVGAPLLERIVAVASTEVLEANQSLVTEGEVGEDLYFVQQGSFVVTVLDGETGTEVGRLGPGDVVGEIQLISGGRRTATVRALEKSVVLRLPHAEMDALVIESEPLREALATVISQRLREAALRVALPHAVGSDPDLLDLLCERAAWVRLERNEILWKQGSAANGWYVLVSGELSVFVDKHGTRREFGTVRRGEVFGEVALVRNEARSSTIVAPRESWVARFDADLFDNEILARAGALRSLVRSLADRLSASIKPAADAARVIALLPRDEETDSEGLVRELATALGSGGLVVDASVLCREGVVGDAEHLSSNHPGWLRFEAWVESRRHDHSYLLLVTRGEDSPWTRAALDQADTLLLLVDADADPARTELERTLVDRGDASRAPPVWLVLEHPAEREIPAGTAAWLDARNLAHHAHLRRGHARDIARLARWLMGQTTGIALSGGGARGFVHLGVAAAVSEFGGEIDLIAGTSAGSMAGGLLARDESAEQLLTRGLTAIEAHGNPFVEFDLPIIAVLRNRRMSNGLHATYGDVAIEDSWIPLRIVATNLTESRRIVFDRGPVWERVLAASSPPGIMAPIKDGEHLLCDGGLVDNLPVSVLLESGCETKLASYVGSAPALPAPGKGFPSSWSLLLDKLLRRQRHADVPTLLTTFFQCVTVPAAAQLEHARTAADVFFQPDLSEFSVTDIKSASAMFETGREHAREVLRSAAECTGAK